MSDPETKTDSSKTKVSFGGLRVAAFESRRCDELTKMIQKFDGEAFVSPSMREIPIEKNRIAIDFAHRVLTGEINVVIFLTGVGFRYLLEAVTKEIDQTRFLETLSDITTICRGPKPTAVMKEFGLTPTLKVPEPNTWRDLLTSIDENISIASQTVGLQEYGVENKSLIAGLEARGADVYRVPVYKWGLPIDCTELMANVKRIADNETDVVMFTSANQIINAISVAESENIEEAFRDGLSSAVVVSIGPTTTEMLRSNGLPMDLEPGHPKMGHMVVAAAEQAENLRTRKRQVQIAITESGKTVLDPNAEWYNNPFMKACRGEPTDVTPIWMMRQAGRYMQEYRDVRSKTTFLELCKNPSLCSEVMCTAVSRLGVDAAIIFSDLLPILEPMGMDLEFAKGEGPVIHNPIREPADIDRLIALESVDSLHFVMETVSQTRNDLPADIPLIGFSGSPFTLASYAIEGGSSKSYIHTKTLMYRDESAWNELMQRFVRSITQYCNAQIAAGAQVMQLFDSWVGCLSPRDYRRYVLPYMQAIIRNITPGIPVINFGTGNPQLMSLYAEGGSQVIGADWRIPLDEAWETIGHDKSIQGNLDPLILLADRDMIRSRAKEILDQAAKRPGHIFNLGHGIVPQTPVDNAIALVDIVHELSSK